MTSTAQTTCSARCRTAAIPSRIALSSLTTFIDVKAEHDFDVNVLALRSLAELLADVHGQTNQRNLLRRIDDLLGADPGRHTEQPH